MEFFYYLIGIFLFTTMIHIVVMKNRRTAHSIFDIVLRHYVFILFGVSGIIAGLGHVFKGPELAAYIGWPANNPFQYEVGVANIAFGIVGLMSFFSGYAFRLAAGMGISLFMVGAGIGHIQQMTSAQNYNPGNAGMPLYLDFVMPTLFLLLVVLHLISSRLSSISDEPSADPTTP